MRTLWSPPPGSQVSGRRSAAVCRAFPTRTVLASKGSLRRAKNRRALAFCAPFCRFYLATGGSAGNQIQNSFFVLPKTKTRM
jgi:hypothetical protein